MENGPTIVLFWLLTAVVFLCMIAFMFAAIIFIKKGNGQGNKKAKFCGKLCLIASMVCAAPVMIIIGYCLYLYAA